MRSNCSNGIETELLAPAGSFDSARAAVNAGADAIYMGGPLFSARAYAESSGEDMLLRTLDFCHLRDVRVFMTLNTLLKDAELATVRDYLKPYADKGLDGVIVQDLGVMHLVREYYPELELHVSTQMAVTGVRTARRLMEMGAKRIVLARELSLKEISEIYEQTQAELEVFAHGALCYSYSGNCLMSSFIGGRSGNRGRCAGTCRLPFDAYDEDGKKLNRKNEQYLLSMCDLNTLSRLPEMIEAGVYSFKIEGRMKSPEYTAAVTSVYRKYLDKAMAYAAENAAAGKAAPGAAAAAVSGSQESAYDQPYAAAGPERAKASTAAKEKKEKQTAKARYAVASEDERLLTEVFDRAGVTDGYLDGRNGRDMVTAAGKPEYRERNEALIDDIRARYIDKDIKLSIYAKVKLIKDEPIELEYSCGRSKVKVKSQMTVQEADKRPTSMDEVADKIGKLGDTDFVLEDAEIELAENCFVPMRALNELRREAADNLAACILRDYCKEQKHCHKPSVLTDCQKQVAGNALSGGAASADDINSCGLGLMHSDSETVSDKYGTQESQKQPVHSLDSVGIRVTVETAEQFEACLEAADIVHIDSAFFEPKDYSTCVQQAHAAGKLIGLRMPYIWRDKAERYFNEHIEAVRQAGFDAYLFRNMESLLYFYENGLLRSTPFATDSSMYVFNREAGAELAELIPEDVRVNYAYACLPLELNGRELEELCRKHIAQAEVCLNAANAADNVRGCGFDETEAYEKHLQLQLAQPYKELTVYGRAPMMVSAQCINKTVHGCDKRQCCLKLKDRKGAEMPVKNICRFCYNEIYNSVPTVLYDMSDTIERIAPDALRYDFTTETAQEVREILAKVPLKAGTFTRGHLKRGV